MKTLNRLITICLMGLLSACAIGQGNHSEDGSHQSSSDYQSRAAESNSAIHRSGTDPITHDSLENFGLLELLDPLGKIEQSYNDKHSGAKQKFKDLWAKNRYDILFAQFGETQGYVQSHKLRRNLIQNRLIAASDRRCGRFFQYMKRDNADMNFGFGLAGSAFSTLGALVPGLQAAQVFSGLGALVSGVRAEYNNEYYSNLAVSVITKGIEAKRSTLRGVIKTSQTANYERYDIAAAVADAVVYDASCNIVYGLEQANEAIQRLNDPSRDAISRALIKDKLNRALTSSDDTELKKFKVTLDTLGLSLAPVVQNLMGNNADAARQQGDEDEAGVADITTNNIVAGVAESLISIRKQLLANGIDLKDAMSATSTDTANEKRKDDVSGLIDQTINKLNKSIASDFSSEKNSCFKEAEDLTQQLASSVAALQIAKANGEATRTQQDAVIDVKLNAKDFNLKLKRYELVVHELTETQLNIFKAAIAEKKDWAIIWANISPKYAIEPLIGNINSRRRCATPVATK